jgi:hypothetical protein
MIPLLLTLALLQTPMTTDEIWRMVQNNLAAPTWYDPAVTAAAIAAQSDDPTRTTWTYEGTLPPGLTLGDDGQLTGTPTQAGTYTFRIRAVVPILGTLVRTVVVTIAPATVIDPAPAPPGVVGTAYQHQFQIKSQETIQ